MGARSFCIEVVGYSVEESFNQMKEDYTFENGHDYYHGGGMRLCGALTYKFAYEKVKKENEKEVSKLIKDYIGIAEKNELKYIDLGIIECHLKTIKKKKLKIDKPIYEYEFLVYTGGFDDKKLCNKKTLIEAENKMLEYAKTYPNAYVSKEYVLKSGSPIVSEVDVTIKVVKSKPKEIKPNQEFMELHKYVIFGMLPE